VPVPADTSRLPPVNFRLSPDRIEISELVAASVDEPPKISIDPAALDSASPLDIDTPPVDERDEDPLWRTIDPVLAMSIDDDVEIDVTASPIMVNEPPVSPPPDLIDTDPPILPPPAEIDTDPPSCSPTNVPLFWPL
jgi:hypothetical protein